jgi:uncharacterized protein YbjT (DUF2867 family)
VDIVIAGGHGTVARHLGRLLAERGDRVRGLIRKPEQRGDLEQLGVDPVLLDLEEASVDGYRDAIAGADAAVFAAGAGPGSGAARKETVDHGAAVKLAEAARAAGVGRYVMVSAMGTDDPPDGDDVFAVYLRAKARADRELMASDLDWTVVRPGRLTDDEGTGRVELARHVDRGEVPREDVAAVLVAVLDDDRTSGHVFELVGGDTPVHDAIGGLVTGTNGARGTRRTRRRRGA